jgi:hypothetical protein
VLVFIARGRDLCTSCLSSMQPDVSVLSTMTMMFVWRATSTLASCVQTCQRRGFGAMHGVCTGASYGHWQHGERRQAATFSGRRGPGRWRWPPTMCKTHDSACNVACCARIKLFQVARVVICLCIDRSPAVQPETAAYVRKMCGFCFKASNLSQKHLCTNADGACRC